MTTSTIQPRRTPWPVLPRASMLGTVIAGAAALFVVASALTLLDQIAPSLPLAVVGGLALMFLVALSVARYEVAVMLGFLLSGVVKIEPAPPDGVFAVVIAVALVTGRLRLDRLPRLVALALAGLTVLNVLSFAAADSMSIGVRFASITIYLILFAAWLAGYADRDRRGRQIVIAWLWIAVFSALIGSLALALPSFPLRLQFIADGSSRASALFKDPNVFGPFLVPVALIVLEELVSPRVLRLRMLSGLVILSVLTTGMVFSFSRAAWANMLVSTAILFAVLLLRRRTSGRLLPIMGGLAVVGMVVMSVIVLSGSADFIGQRAQLQGYDSERFGAQRAGIQLAGEYPLGVGPGQFQFHHPVETHSTYVRVLAEQGPLGLALWLTLCVGTLGIAIANAIAGRRSGGIGSAALLGAWIGLLLNSVVVDTLHWRHLWVVAGLIWAGALTGKLADRRSDA